ncbi:uncharacterized protein BDW70DRAFT_165130 [Aspergillus foveolatus]|uniref:uncharacterized protein n=1 Tax=Aspergillus foveolatus TaxID=210207 RepID=UPI003CCD52A9
MASSQCTRLHNQCDECRIARSKLPRWINPSFLECTGSTYPVTFTGTYVGSRTQAEHLVGIIRSCVSGLYGHDVPIHAAFQRATDPDTGVKAGPWVDITTDNSQSDAWGLGVLPPGTKVPGTKWKSAYKPTRNLLFKAPRLIGLAEPKAFYDRQYKGHLKKRVIACLVDYPHKIQKGGDMEQVIMHRLESQGFNGYTRHPESEQDQTPHASLHRLDWWVFTHPEIVMEDPPKLSRETKYKPCEVYIKNNAYVRKKR